MPRLKVITQSFSQNDPWAVGNRSREFDVSIPELLHAAITVGHPDYSVVLGGGQVAAAYEIMWKVASTMMTLREFGGPYSRPDLIGQDVNGDHYVFESKGRMSPPNASDKQKAKTQAQRVVSVSGATPVLAASCMAYFRKDYYRTRKHLECFVEDPPFDDEPEDLETHELDVESDEIIRDYYRPLIPLFDESMRAEEGEALVWKSREFDVDILIDAKVNYLWRSEQYGAIRSYLSERTPHTGVSESHAYDGIEIRPGQRWLDLAKQDVIDDSAE